MTEPGASVAALTIRLFGPIQVLVHGQPLPRLNSRTSLWLLALLTLRPNRPVEREWLSGTLWPDRDPSQAFANLRPILSGLRSALGSEGWRLQSPDRLTLFLELTDAEVDVHTFDAAMASKQLSALEQAVALYHGPLLEGCDYEWASEERAVREQSCVQALQTLANSALSARDYTTAVGYYQRAVGLNPWLESARRGWMEALAKSGDTNAALLVYREFVAFLKDDPRAVPDEQTTALYERLRSEVRQRASTHAAVTVETAPVPSIKGYLPHALTALVGREDERQEVALLLRHSRVVTLTGPGGIGKTRLAMAIAAEVVGEYADGVWLMGLEALSEGRQVIQKVASVLGLREEQRRTLLETVTASLRQKRLLLVLDNCEHLRQDCAELTARLLQECGQVCILATSREALGIPGETAWSVPALAVPDLAYLPQGATPLVRVLQGYESVQLFVERARAVQKTFALSGSNARLVAQACRQLEGIPLAIELAAARVRALSVAQIASRLDDYLGFLTGGSRTAQSRQQTLRATLDWSYALLSEAERSLLRRLSVFAGGCTREAAEFVCGADAGVQVLELLTSLVDKSLVTFEEREGADRRYRLLEMVRQYAAESLQASGEAEQVKERHQGWCLLFAQQAEPALRTGEQGRWLTRLEAEHDNLRSALTWSLRNKGGSHPHSPTALRLCSALQQFWSIHGHLSEGRAWCEHALQAAATGERTEARAKALNGAGSLALLQGDYTAAQARYQECLEIQREVGDRSGIANALNNLGLVAYQQGDYVSAQAHYQQSLAIRREIGNRYNIAGSLNNLGNIAKEQGDYDTARAFYEEALVINRELGTRTWEAVNLNNLGLVASIQGDYVSAQAHYQQSLTIKRELGDRQGIANALNNLGSVARDQCNYSSARALHEESLAIRRELGDRPGIAASLSNLGNAATQQGEYPRARALYEESLTIKREIGDRQGIAISLEAIVTLIMAEAPFASAAAETAEGSGEIGVRQRRVARLWGAAQALRKQIGVPLLPREQAVFELLMGQARSALGEEHFATAWEEGRAMTLEQAVAYALQQD